LRKRLKKVKRELCTKWRSQAELGNEGNIREPPVGQMAQAMADLARLGEEKFAGILAARILSD